MYKTPESSAYTPPTRVFSFKITRQTLLYAFISEEDSSIEFTSFLRGVKDKRLVLPSPFTPYPYGKGSFVALFKQLLKKNKRRKKSPSTKNADRQKGTEKLIKMIRQFILISVIFPGGGRAFFDVSITVGFCRYGMCFMAATSF